MSVSYGGTISAINQANSVGQEDSNLQAGISSLNNQNLANFNLLNQGQQSQDKGEEQDNLARLGGYSTAIAEKYKEYQDFVKEGKDVGKLKSVRLARGVGNLLTKSKPEYTGPDASSFSAEARDNFLTNRRQSLAERTQFPEGTGTEDAPAPADAPTGPADAPTPAPPDDNAPVDTGGGGPDTDPPDTSGTPADQPTTTDPADDSDDGGPEPEPEPLQDDDPAGTPDEPATNGTGTTETTVANNSTVEPSPDPAGEDDASTLRTIEEGGEEGVGFAGKVAKVGGGIFSLGMLGDDVYNQVKDKSFFYGENTGDKVGNFMNELGSAGDVLGLATGDPLLVLAGTGLGAIGSVVSDVSELFAHHKKQTTTNSTPPAVIGPSTAQNIAGTGGIAETTGSSLRTVQMGGS